MTFPLDDRARGVILLVLLLLGLASVVLLGPVLMPFYVAFALVYLLNPVVSTLATVHLGQLRVSRLGAIIGVYVGAALALWFLGLVVLPKLYVEFARLAVLLPQEVMHFEREVLPEWVIRWQGHLDAYNVPFDIKKTMADSMTGFFDSLQGQVGEVAKRAKDVIAGVFSTLLSLVLVFMLTGFLLYDLPRLQAWLKRLVPDAYLPAVATLMLDIDRGLAGAVRGQLLVCLVNAVLTTGGLMVLGVKFAITLGVVAGVCSLIPVFGTLISTIPAVLVGLTHSLVTALLVLLWILAIHLVEANVLNPNIIGHNAELHPALVVLALLIGEHFGGVAGLLIAVPLATVIRSLLIFTLGRVLMPGAPPDEPPLASAPEEGPLEGLVALQTEVG